jgi:hypothetical protein
LVLAGAIVWYLWGSDGLMPFVIGFGLGAVLDDFEHLERREGA